MEVWLAERLGGPGSRYHLAFGFDIDGPLDPGALESACQALLARHPALLTRFPESGGEPARAAVPLAACRLERIAAPRGWADDSLRELVTAPFDLASGPLVRTALARTGTDSHALLFVCHHLVFDGTSRDLVARDLAALYNAALRGTDPGLPPLPPYQDPPYQDPPHQDAADRDPAGRAELAALAADPARLSDCLAPPRAPRSAQLPIELDFGSETRSGLAGLAAGCGGSVFAMLLGTFTALLDKYHRPAAGEPPVIMIPCDTRPPTHADCVGLFVNELPFRCPPGPDASLRQHLAATARRLRQTLALRAVPLADLSRRTGDSAAASPAVILGYRRTRPPGPAWDGLRVRYLPWLPVPDGRAELEIQLLDDGTTVAGRLLGDPARLGADLPRQLAAQWRAGLGRALSLPDLPLARWGLLDPDQARQVVTGWNRTAVPRPDPDTLPRRFEAQVAATPEAVALVSDAPTGATAPAPLTYRELNRKANRLAHLLRARGIGPGKLVGVCLERSPELVVALLGVLKAGAGYLPLDPEHPPARRAAGLRDSAAGVLVTRRGLADGPPGPDPPGHSDPQGYEVVTLGPDDAEVCGGQPDTDPVPWAGPGDAAYVIYTSGSTGRPKGVVVSHAAIANRLAWMQETYQLGGHDRVLHKTSIGFDVSVWELLWPLLAGARLVLARPGGHRDVPYLIDVINRTGVTTVHFVPPMLDAFVDDPASATCRGLRRVICSGEALPGRLVRRFHTRLAACELHNLYGPTEAAIDVSSWACEPAAAGDRVPIGRPIANTRLHILGPDLQPVPVGVTGELYIGGAGLARGYLGQPARTAERFLPDPFRDDGSRLYRTGDLARYRDDGVIEFLGRIDHQLKVRGVRIEPAEIEAALAEHPAVRQAVVVARERAGGGDGERFLAGYVVPAGRPAADRAVLGERLREHLRQLLPEPMVPATIVVLEALPLTASGKVDRRALPEPPAPDGAGYQAPGTETERLVARVWSDLFEVARVGAEDDFFALGGHSLLATRTLARLRDAAGVDLPMRVVFECSTVRALAAAVEEASRR